jgi:hypothetical protein
VVEQAMSLRYLGVKVTSNGALKSEVKHQACKAVRLSGYLYDTVYRNKYLRTEPEERVYKTVTLPVLTHPTEAKAITCRTKEIIETYREEHLKENCRECKSRSWKKPLY